MMRAMRLGEIASALGLAVPGEEQVMVSGLSTDTRTLQPGELFVALAGDRHDAHDYVADAVAAGAAALLCSRPVQAAVPVLLVADTLLALGDVARLHRSLYAGSLVALTGSAGKTTTKEMIAAILGLAGPVLATRGNLNNEIGVPLTLMRLEPGHRNAVIEMGAARPGDIAYLAGIARPDVALVTNALQAHLEGFGTVEAVARTKGQIYEALGADGIAVLNVDDPHAALWATQIGSRRTVRVSARGAPGAEVRAREVRLEEGCARFALESPAATLELALRLPGVQQVANAVAAAGVAFALGIDASAVSRGLQSLVPMAGRMAGRRGRGGCRLLDDTYNANPGSVRAAIETLASFPGTRVLVLGNMAELGARSAELHRECGRFARECGIDHVLATGPEAAAVAEGFGAGGRSLPTRESLIDACRELDREGVTMLVKGSRSAAMERVVEALLAAEPGLARVEAH